MEMESYDDEERKKCSKKVDAVFDALREIKRKLREDVKDFNKQEELFMKVLSGMAKFKSIDPLVDKVLELELERKKDEIQEQDEEEGEDRVSVMEMFEDFSDNETEDDDGMDS